MKNRSCLFLTVALYLCAAPENAYCYLDPGTGSFVLQIVMAAVFSVVFAVKLFWGKIKAFFRNLFTKNP